MNSSKLKEMKKELSDLRMQELLYKMAGNRQDDLENISKVIASKKKEMASEIIKLSKKGK